VQGLLDGLWDVAFVRTGQVERTIDPATGEIIDPSLVKVLEPRIQVMDNGELFPFLHSTPVFPEWPLSAMENVDRVVSEEVAKAMVNLEWHIIVGEAIHACMEEAMTPEEMNVCDTMPPVYFDPTVRCDTTRELAELAYQAGRAGFHDGFRSPRSHYSVRTMQQDAGFIVEDEGLGKWKPLLSRIVFTFEAHLFFFAYHPKGNWHCQRGSSLYNAISCPEGHYKVPEDEFDKDCEDVGTPCPEGYSCYCSPCIKANKVAVYPVNNDTKRDAELNRDTGCAKMSQCGRAEQTKEIFFRVFDNRKRVGATVKVLMLFGDEERDLRIEQVEPYLYEFGFSHTNRGVAILQISVDGVQIPESPVRVKVSARDCETDYPNQSKLPVRRICVTPQHSSFRPQQLRNHSLAVLSLSFSQNRHAH
jgi:hypothetical protein